MPKLPLFQDQPLDPDAIEEFRILLTKPETPEDLALIDDLLDLHKNPHTPISERLASCVLDCGLLRSVMLENILCNSVGRPHMWGKTGAIQLQLNQRVLACAAAAGFLPFEMPIQQSSSRHGCPGTPGQACRPVERPATGSGPSKLEV